MKNRVFKKVFTDKNRLNSMIQFRQKGFSYLSLAVIYGVDHSSIYYICKKYGVEKGGHNIEFSIPTIISLSDVTVRRRPKSYAEYLEEAKNREYQKRFSHLTARM